MRLGSWTGWAIGLTVLVAVALHEPSLGELGISAVSDLTQLAAALAATAAATVAARRAAGDRARAWAWLARGTGSWAAGQVVWTWYELVLGREVPFPSLADGGFLLCPVAMTVGLVVWLGSQGHELAARGRDVLDGAVVATALLVLSWVTALGAVVRAGADSWVPLALSLAYPVGDLVVASLILMALARGGRGERGILAVLALGIGGLAASDSAYVYLVGLGDYSSASGASVGWVVGFLMIAAAALGQVRAVAAPDEVAQRAPTGRDEFSLLRLLVPYVPVVGAGLVLVVTLLRTATTSTVAVLLGLALVLLVLSRQFLEMLDNRRLVDALHQTQARLRHQATHDGLTGLANRTRFTDALHEALRRPDAEVSVLYCDLDDFKRVNDDLGHAAGDVLLSVVARRLLQCVRATDTVARLGGDEFAVLVGSDQAALVAERMRDVLSRPVEVQGAVLTTSASIGIAHHRSSDALSMSTSTRPRLLVEQEALGQQILRQADAAMYVAKQAGKGRVVTSDAAA